MKMRLLLMALATLLVVNTAQAQLPISLRVSALYANQSASIEATAAGQDVGATDTRVNGLGAEVRVGLPGVGVDLGVHYLRHFGDTDPEFEGNINDVAAIGVGANEFGLFAEKRHTLVPLSPIKPFLGVGVSYSRIELSSSFDLTAGVDGADDISSSANIGRLYGMGGIEMLGGLGLVVRAGYTFSGVYELEADLPIQIDGADAGIEIDYDGFFASVGVSLFGI